jgi:4-hydroxy-tetrahydrodipicolinate reductase
MSGVTGPVRVALFGATGRMGRSIIRAIAESTDYVLTGAGVSATSALLGEDAGRVAGLTAPFGVPTSADPRVVVAQADCVLDFSSADGVLEHAFEAASQSVPIVIGTTGLAPETHTELARIAESVAVLVAPNTSLGVNLLARLVEQAAAALPHDYDIEIIEAHHRYKLDAPSGTALHLGAAAARGRGTPAVAPSADRSGARSAGSIGFACVRGGDIVGEHTVIYAGPGERLELVHRAHDRMTFAHGALRAAAWLRGRGPGRYGMADVLGLG